MLFPEANQNIPGERNQRPTEEYDRLCQEITPIIRSIYNGEIDFDGEAVCSLFTNQPFYYNDFLQTNEAKVLAIIESSGVKFAVVLTFDYIYDSTTKQINLKIIIILRLKYNLPTSRISDCYIFCQIF